MGKMAIIRKLLSNKFNHDERIVFCPSPLARKEDIITTHTEDYYHRFVEGKLSDYEIRKLGFPWSTDIVKRSLGSVGGTVEATRVVLEDGHLGCAHLAGGSHHGHRDFGEGYCAFNDIAVASNIALNKGIKRILIVDLDVHQGNGTASIFENESRVFTFSAHCKQNYFSNKVHSDLDLELDPNISNDDYLMKIESTLYELFQIHRPELVFYQSGVDICDGDRLGKMKISIPACKRRNEIVYEMTKKFNAKLVVTMGGGLA